MRVGTVVRSPAKKMVLHNSMKQGHRFIVHIGIHVVYVHIHNNYMLYILHVWQRDENT